MRLFRNFHLLKLIRWSYTVPILCYCLFIIMTWMFIVPLKPNNKKLHQSINNNNNWRTYMKIGQSPEDTFEVRIKNSHFNSDQDDNYLNNNNNIANRNNNEYLINSNARENLHKGQTQILTEVFKRADLNLDNKLDVKELSQWIRMKIIQHISEAVGNNNELFAKIDTNPQNGVVTWKEYHSYFLKKRGFGETYVRSHNEKRHKGLKRTIREQIMKDRALWSEAAKSSPDFLTVDEFLAFTHPESSLNNQLAMVDELYEKFDKDGDEFLTENEFAIFQAEGIDDQPILYRQEEAQRRQEFRNVIDLNGDGKADRKELLHYIAPQSPRHADHEAEALLALADSNQNSFLSLEEILIRPDLFLKSKMVDTARSFHDEF